MAEISSAPSSVDMEERFAPSPSPSPLPDVIQTQRQGGFLIALFLIVSDAFEKVANYGLWPRMLHYLHMEYHTDLVTGIKMMFYWTTAMSYMPLIGSIVSDSYLGRFRSVGIGSVVTLLGMILFWFTTVFSMLKPPPCDGQSCESATHSQLAFLFITYTLMTLGAGLFRPCSLSFAVEQIDKRDQVSQNKVVLESFFRWYYVSKTAAYLVAITAIVYLQVHEGWSLGFVIPIIFMIFSTITFLSASRRYIKLEAKRSLLTSFAKVVVAAYKKRNVPFPPQNIDGGYHHEEAQRGAPSRRLRFLNKACVITTPDDVNPDGVVSSSWSLCSVEQVEELKALMRVIPLWSSLIMVAIGKTQATNPLISSSKGLHVGSLHVPASYIRPTVSIGVIIFVFLFHGIAIPITSRIRGDQVYFGVRLRMGIGLGFACLATVASAVVAHVRQRKANNGDANMSVMWLLPQFLLSGLANAFNEIAQTQFYFQELPKSMASIASALFLLGVSVATWAGNLIYTTITESNYEHYEFYYWILAIACFVNFLYFIVCSWAYGPCVDEIADDEERADFS